MTGSIPPVQYKEILRIVREELDRSRLEDSQRFEVPANSRMRQHSGQLREVGAKADRNELTLDHVMRTVRDLEKRVDELRIAKAKAMGYASAVSAIVTLVIQYFS